MTTFEQSVVQHFQNDPQFQKDSLAIENSKQVTMLSKGQTDSMIPVNDIPFDQYLCMYRSYL